MRCDFCYRNCDIPLGGYGYCKVRKNVDNKIISVNYGYLDAIAIDPIEKKPLFHFLPGTKTLSIAQAGCNFNCEYCQNWEISQQTSLHAKNYVSAENVVQLAKKYKTPSISFTYSEPIVWLDFVIDCAKIAKKNNIKTIMVTNGSFSNKSLEKISLYIDAINIDLKGDSKFYKEICKGDFTSTIDSINYLINKKKHVEITSLIIERYHTLEIIKELAMLLERANIKVWHISRFFPNYKMIDEKETSEEYLDVVIKEISKFNIPYVYGGNTTTIYSTICPNCNKILISNHTNQFDIKKDLRKNVLNNKCINCNHIIYGTF